MSASTRCARALVSRYARRGLSSWRRWRMSGAKSSLHAYFAHGKSNSVSVTEFSVTWGSNEKLACKNRKISVGGLYSIALSYLKLSRVLMQPNVPTNAPSHRGYYFSLVNFFSGPRSVTQTETFFRVPVRTVKYFWDAHTAKLFVPYSHIDSFIAHSRFYISFSSISIFTSLTRRFPNSTQRYRQTVYSITSLYYKTRANHVRIFRFVLIETFARRV